MTEHVLSLNCPREIRKIPWGLLSANARPHWSVAREVARHWRHTAAATAKAAGIPPMRRAHVTVTFHKATGRRYDPGNLSPVSKAIVDGALVDAGILPDDSSEYLIGPDHRAGEKASTPHITVTIRELED